MNLLNNVGQKIGKTAKSVTKKSEELVEITKINHTIGNEEDKINKLLGEIGANIYNRFANGESFDEYLNDKCSQLKAIENTVEELKLKIKNIKEHNSGSDDDNTAKS